MRPGARHSGQAGDGVQVGGAVTAAGEAEATADEGAAGAAIQRRKRLDLFHAQPGDAGRPVRRSGGEMGLQRRGVVGVARHVLVVGVAVAKSHVHHGAGECRVRARPQSQMQVRRGGGAGAIGIDDHQLGAPLLACAGDVGHGVDLGGHGVAAPHHDQVARRHLPRIGPGDPAHAGGPTGEGDRGADSVLTAGIAHGVGQAVQPIPVDQPHGPRRVERPHGFRPMARRHVAEGSRDTVQRFVPANTAELSAALRAGAQQGMGQPIRMVDALGIARDLGADHARRVWVVGPTHRADARAVDDLNIQCAGRRAVVRANGTVGLRASGKRHVHDQPCLDLGGTAKPPSGTRTTGITGDTSARPQHASRPRHTLDTPIGQTCKPTVGSGHARA